MSPHRPRPITVENAWLNKSLEDKIQILRTVAPDQVDALGLIVDDVLRREWKTIGHTATRDGGDR
jgi:hypothetical protein